MHLSYRPERVAFLKSVGSNLLPLVWKIADSKAQVVRVFDHGQHLFRLLQADLPLCRLAGGLLDVLVHAVHYRPGEVRLGVGQSLLVVRAGGLGQGQKSLALQVRQQGGLLPRRA